MSIEEIPDIPWYLTFGSSSTDYPDVVESVKDLIFWSVYHSREAFIPEKARKERLKMYNITKAKKEAYMRKEREKREAELERLKDRQFQYLRSSPLRIFADGEEIPYDSKVKTLNGKSISLLKALKNYLSLNGDPERDSKEFRRELHELSGRRLIGVPFYESIPDSKKLERIKGLRFEWKP